jgi:Zn-dependent M28 family amino/carboxypeptidase
MGVGVMLDIARVIVDRDEPFDNSVIFMWNGAEETLQDGSHLYSTQHPSAKDIKAVINLEAAGTTGGALLFQATSKEMIEAFSHAPHPRGTVAAADVFASGIILSDTDFGQFEKYLGISGLDMAIVGHSYFYHTRSDIVKYVEKGSAQHFGDNVLAIVDHLLNNSTTLSSGKFTPPDMVYLGLFDRVFFSWSMKAADKAYLIIAALVTISTFANVTWGKSMLLTVVGAPLGLVAGLLSANALAGFLTLIGKRQLW